MRIELEILLLIVLVIATFYICIKRKIKNNTPNLATRFRKQFISKNRFREKIKIDPMEYLMIDPDRNIKIGAWDSEIELREKADIHRSRLHKYGRSKLNNEIIYMELKGKIYKHNNAGEKIYI